MSLTQANCLPDSLSQEFWLRKTDWSGRGGDSWLTRDKRLHLVVSAAMVGVSHHLLHDRWHCQAEESQYISVSVTGLAGLLKEFSDRRRVPPTCSYKDLIADGLGVLVGILVFAR